MGVLMESSFLIAAKVGVDAEVTIGDLNSDGYVADRGVLRADNVGLESVVAIAVVVVVVNERLVGAVLPP